MLEFVDRVRSFLFFSERMELGWIRRLFVCCRLGVLTLLVEGSGIVCCGCLCRREELEKGLLSP